MLKILHNQYMNLRIKTPKGVFFVAERKKWKGAQSFNFIIWIRDQTNRDSGKPLLYARFVSPTGLRVLIPYVMVGVYEARSAPYITCCLF